MEFRLFAYGTLKHGTPAHARYLHGAVRWARAWTYGRLYEHRDGYPVMIAPARAIHRTGTRDALADARAAGRPAAQTHWRLAGRPAPALGLATCNAWVRGELLRFAARQAALDALDEYEGFVAEAPSAFVRALIDVEIAAAPPGAACARTTVRAWAYVAGTLMTPADLSPVPLGVWRP
jgi:gamma-glutamylcyclotransferase (GGCT)/AIG2-like uncharacterized protein YtfP